MLTVHSVLGVLWWGIYRGELQWAGTSVDYIMHCATWKHYGITCTQVVAGGAGTVIRIDTYHCFSHFNPQHLVAAWMGFLTHFATYRDAHNFNLQFRTSPNDIAECTISLGSTHQVAYIRFCIGCICSMTTRLTHETSFLS